MQQPTVRFGMMIPVAGGVADSTTPVVADSNMLVALNQAVKIA
jgi:hypothetical protein